MRFYVFKYVLTIYLAMIPGWSMVSGSLSPYIALRNALARNYLASYTIRSAAIGEQILNVIKRLLKQAAGTPLYIFLHPIHGNYYTYFWHLSLFFAFYIRSTLMGRFISIILASFSALSVGVFTYSR